MQPCDQARAGMRHTVRVGFVLACIVSCSAAPAAHATIQEESCIYPDVEYPLPCDEDDED